VSPNSSTLASAHTTRWAQSLGDRLEWAAQDGESCIGKLTGRELRMARLLVDRRTHAEIAAVLFLSMARDSRYRSGGDPLVRGLELNVAHRSSFDCSA